MNIFVNEAGIFVIPRKKKSSVSCVGALMVPEWVTRKVFDEFLKLKESWGVKEGEIKGSKLNEPKNKIHIKQGRGRLTGALSLLLTVFVSQC